MSKVAALEYADRGTKEARGITVNCCICPGWTETAIIEPQVQARAAEHGGNRAAGIVSLLVESSRPGGPRIRPRSGNQLALWLTPPIAHNITGTAIPIDGGWTAQ
jgi:3-hydroxybutyrate dehydrogenase